MTGDDELESKVADFWRRTRPIVLEGYARQVTSHSDSPEAGQLAHALLWLHYHAIAGSEEAVRAAANRACSLGATRDDLVELLALAFVNAGPLGMRRAARACEDLISTPETDAQAPRRFPPGWVADETAMRSGLDFSQPELSADEMASLRQWYLRVLREVPPYVEFLWRYRPALLKVFRNRLETAVRDSLPKQVIPFVLLHYEATRGSGPGVYEQALLARGFGLTRNQVFESLNAAFLYSGPAAAGVVQAAAGDILRELPE